PLHIFLNGHEIVSSGIEAVSGEGNDLIYFDLTPFLDLVHAGANVVAIKLNNTWASDWDNVAFDVSLRAISSDSGSSSTAKFNGFARSAGGTITFNITGPNNSAWALETTTNPADSTSWQRL